MTAERRPVRVQTTISGVPGSFILDGVTWLVAAEPVRWFERVSWWETERRMSVRDGGARIDVEVWQLQARPAKATAGPLTTFELIRDGAGWRVRSEVVDR